MFSMPGLEFYCCHEMPKNWDQKVSHFHAHCPEHVMQFRYTWHREASHTDIHTQEDHSLFSICHLELLWLF